MTEQAVTETTNDVASQTSEGVSELDSLLEEFNEPEPEKVQTKSSTDDTKNELKEFLASAKADNAAKQRDESNQGIRESAKTLSESLDLGFDDAKNEKVAKGLLLNAAEDNPKIGVAFANRKSNPAAWNSILSAIAKEFGDGKVDTNATGSRDAMAQSLSKGGNQSQSSDDDSALNKKLNKMSDSEFEVYVQDQA